MRIKFAKNKQKEFFNEVLANMNCPSLRELRKRGLDVSYSALKNYFCGRRNISEDLFDQILELSRLNKNNFDYEVLDDNYGQVFGGKKSRR